MAKGAKIGEGRVEITADTSKLNAGLRDAKGKVEEFGKQTSEGIAGKITNAFKGIGAAIAVAIAGFQAGTAIGKIVRDIREANLLLGDLQREYGASAEAFFKVTQNKKGEYQISRLENQFREIGNIAGAGSKIAAKEFEMAEKAVREKHAELVQGQIDKAEKDLDHDTKRFIRMLREIDVASGGPDGILSLEKQFGKYIMSEGDILNARDAAIKQINQNYSDQLNTLKEIKAMQDSIMQNEESMALFKRQEQQRSGFGLGQVALDPTVLSRELTRAFQNGGRY